ncbi:MAG: hypothetical protein RI887_788, partial [Actinomycetota bacterium]
SEVPTALVPTTTFVNNYKNYVGGLYDAATSDDQRLEIIVKEAGGRFSDLHGNDGINGSGALSSNSLLHDLVLKQISNS